MAHTVKQVATMSGVSIRTLHFYDEIGLLKPAYTAANGYRFYETAQLLRLQQILFYRRLGFDLKEIAKVLDRRGFNKLAALKEHRQRLHQQLLETQQLLQTIDNTIEHLKGTRTMKTEELFAGFNAEEQAKHEDYLVTRYGESMKIQIKESKSRVGKWSKTEWQKASAGFEEICKDLVGCIKARQPAEGTEVQGIISRHFTWLKQFWIPTGESYLGHADLIEQSELRRAYEVYHPDLPEFVAKGIRHYARTQLA
jgi:DNA-binding transcriptional MerR regulator